MKEKDLEKLRDPKASGVEFEVDEYNNGKISYFILLVYIYQL